MDTSKIEKIVSGSASNQEKADFNIWLKESESNSIYYEQLKMLWEKSNKIPELTHFDEVAAKNKISDKIKLRKIELARTKTRRIWISAAASILILLGIGSIISHQKGIQFQNTIEYTAQNSVKEIVLPDNSKVWINVNSKLIVPEKFRQNKRTVTLIGEAYFEIERDESKPFIIHTGKTVTKVLGTSFNIKMDTILENVSIIVNSGRVSFFKQNYEKNGAILQAGNRAEFTAFSESIKYGHNTNQNYLSWKTGILSFQNTPLKDVCEVLTQQYKKHVSTSLSDQNYVITGKFENEKLEDILSTIQMTLDVKIVQNKSHLIITK